MAKGHKDNDFNSMEYKELYDSGSDEFCCLSDELSPEEIKQIKKDYEQVFKNGGIQEIENYITKALTAWKTTPVNIAVIGRSGVGKSTFINAIRNLKADEEGAALTDVVEATKSVKHYSFQSRGNIVLWDLPGVGTNSFPRKSYEERVNKDIEKNNANSLDNIAGFDFYLLLTADRFMEDDVWLAKQIENSYNKKYYLVRTKIDRDIESELKGRNNPRKENEILTVILHDITRNLDVNDEDEIYFIDNLCPNKYDFKKLKGKLITDAPKAKIEAIASSLSSESETLIVSKKKSLLGFRLAFASCHLRHTVDFKVQSTLSNEYSLYKRVFKLTEKDLKCTSDALGMDVESLISTLGLESCKVGAFGGVYAAYKTNIGTVSKFEPPVPQLLDRALFSIPSSLYAWSKTYNFLKSLLNMCAEDAIKIQVELLKLAAKDAEH